MTLGSIIANIFGVILGVVIVWFVYRWIAKKNKKEMIDYDILRMDGTDFLKDGKNIREERQYANQEESYKTQRQNGRARRRNGRGGGSPRLERTEEEISDNRVGVEASSDSREFEEQGDDELPTPETSNNSKRKFKWD